MLSIYELATLPRVTRRIIVAAADATLVAFALWLAISLRLGELYIPPTLISFGIVLATVATSIFLNTRLGLYRQVTRYMDASGHRRIFYINAITAVCLGTFVAISRPEVFPRSAIFVFPVLATIFMIAFRRLIKRLLNHISARLQNQGSAPKQVLIYGAGEAGDLLARELKRVGTHTPVYFIDDDASLSGQKVGSLKVRSPNDIDDILAKRPIEEIYLAIPSLSNMRRREIVLSLEKHPIPVKTVPTISEIVSGEIAISSVRPIDPTELLCREPVTPKIEMLQSAISGKSIMVTGAGGSIGSEIVRQLLSLDLSPAKIVLFELSEAALYNIELQARELLEQRTAKSIKENRIDRPCEIVTCLGSVLDAGIVRAVIQQHQVNTIYHAAAYKHVPIVELNPVYGLRNNTIGTYTIAEIARDLKIERFVLVSTDKAVRPTNVMGASKRLAELVVQANSDHPENETIFSIVRFGNVLASSGSVVHRFKRQIEQGGPVTVTHPDVTRFFMSIEEASQLVIQSSGIAKSGDLFILDMGDSIKIDSLARLMIKLAGLTVDENRDGSGDIVIKYTGLRPGEKLYEELLLNSDSQDTEHSRIKRCIEPYISYEKLQKEISFLKIALSDHDLKGIQQQLLRLVDGYRVSKNSKQNQAA